MDPCPRMETIKGPSSAWDTCPAGLFVASPANSELKLHLWSVLSSEMTTYLLTGAALGRPPPVFVVLCSHMLLLVFKLPQSDIRR